MMQGESDFGVYGFRYQEQPELPLCSLFAVGHEAVDSVSYRWDGLARDDGPLLLFQYTTEGEGFYETGGTRYALTAGQAFLAEIPSAHRYGYPGGTVPWTFYFVLLRPSYVMPLWNRIKGITGPVVTIDAAAMPIRALRQLYAEASAGRIRDPFSASSFLYAFMMELAALVSAPGRDNRNWPDPVREAVRYMEANYAHMPDQQQLSRSLGLSKFHFARLFARHVGLTPNAYVNRIRIERAMELLRTTEWSVERIGTAVGYSTGSYFIKVFRSAAGQTPGAFREGKQGLPYSKLYFD